MRLTPLALALILLGPGLARAAGAAESPLGEEARRTITRSLALLEEQWIGVYLTHDLSFLERILAPDFVATLSDGAMRGKREHIAAYPADFEAFASVVASETQVRVYTPELAVVTGLYTVLFRHPEGQGEGGRYRFTDVWVLRAGAWQCVATQETRVP
ncbi:MAG TPA: nuclear transport factor 2 family protein [Vicinamibacteria bacterium]|nr:nuclear transport factor 2 family protein [Vicinamibacteria bacterium]